MNNFAINSDFVAFRKGQYVDRSINERSGEFLLSEKTDFSKATLQEIAAANDLHVPSKLNKSDYHAEIINQLNQKDIPTMDQKPQNELVKDVVREGNEQGLDDDAMLIKLVESGVKFSAAMKLFRKAQEELGLRMTAKGRNEYVQEVLGDDFQPGSAEEMQEAINKIAEHDAITEAQARSAVRKYLKEYEREIPKVAKQAVSGGIRAKIHDFIATHPNASTKELGEFISSVQSDAEKAERMTKRFTPTLLLANRIAQSYEG